MAPIREFVSGLRPSRRKKRGDAGSSTPASSSLDVSNTPADTVSTVQTPPNPQIGQTGQSVNTINPDTDSDNFGIREKLWNKAYDWTKEQDGELVAAYEKVLSRELAAISSDSQDNAISSTDLRQRQAQMEGLVQVGMERLGVGKVRAERPLQGLLGLSNIIGTALQPVPQAAIAWVGVSFALQSLVNVTTEARANHEGISYVVMRMDWYSELSQLLLKENAVDGGKSSNLRSQLETRIIDLYSLLLSYLMKSVCSCYQSRVFRYFQNTIKLNDWEGSLKEIQDAEQSLQHDTTQYSTQQMRSNLEALVVIARDRHTELLLGIGKAIQGYAARQAKEKMNEKDKKALKHLCLTDPGDDMERIQQTKDKLLEGSCNWVLDRPDFVNWLERDGGGVYWIKGEPGKGKTMLMIGIIKDMLQMSPEDARISFFFCQNADPNLNNATAVLRGLIYQLASQDESLMAYIREPYDNRGQALFEDTNAFFAMKKILSQIFEHPDMPKMFIIVDALDECLGDLDPLLEFLTGHVSSSKLHCLVSSRPRSEIRNALLEAEECNALDLDESAAEDVKAIVESYIDRQARALAKDKRYSPQLHEQVRSYLQSHSGNTFLWAALVCKQLRKTPVFNVLSILRSFPSGLPALYGRMMEEVYRTDEESPGTLGYCRQILAAITLAYRPLTLDELCLVADLPQQLTEDSANVEAIIDKCGNFLTVRKETVYVVHHSAKEYLSIHTNEVIFPNGRSAVHCGIVSRALKMMSDTLRRDVWNLRDPASSIENIKAPDPNPLDSIGYMCVYWVEHLCQLDAHLQRQLGLCSDGAIEIYIREHLLHWMEALSLLRSLRAGEELLRKLVNIMEVGSLIPSVHDNELLLALQDATHFVDYHRHMIEETPLQVYTSAVIFSPTASRVRLLFESQISPWIQGRPLMEADWRLHLHAINLRNDSGQCVAMFPDGEFLATGRQDGAIEVWDLKKRTVEHIFSGHEDFVVSVAISPDGKTMASGSADNTVILWSWLTRSSITTLTGHKKVVTSVSFSSNGKLLASGSVDTCILIWEVHTGTLRHILATHTSPVYSVAFLGNTQVVSGGSDDTILIWDAITGVNQSSIPHELEEVRSLVHIPDDGSLAICGFTGTHILSLTNERVIQRLGEETSGGVMAALAISPNGSLLAAGPYAGVVQIWDLKTGIAKEELQMDRDITDMAISNDGQTIAIVSSQTVYVWDTATKVSLRTVEGHRSSITYVCLSPCGQWVATGARDGVVVLWARKTGLIVRKLEGHSEAIHCLDFSYDGLRLTSGSSDSNACIWQVQTGALLHTLAGPYKIVRDAKFSADGNKVVLFYEVGKIRIWDAHTGNSIKSIGTTGYQLTSICLSPNGQLLACGDLFGKVAIWNLRTNEVQTVSEESWDIVSNVNFSTDGKHLASMIDYECVAIFDVETWTLQQTLKTGLVRRLRFSEDNSRLLSNRGAIALDWSLPQGSAVDPTWVGYGLDPRNEWVTWNGKRLLRLPVECDGHSCAVVDHTIALVYDDNRIVMLEFEDGADPFALEPEPEPGRLREALLPDGSLQPQKIYHATGV
ncbi:WD40-repeat-containing domain protein [Aspergillus pseudoustus]|uniref:WD40-repeat-containing domain protein n=1 Tax=Aspergillus pseudoustus TaxID=1810923 RepID=A0ABR4J3P2_9EURO